MNKVTVEGINKYKKHLKSRGEGKPGGIIDIEKPLSASNVSLICSSCKKITRIGYREIKNSKKERICKKCKTAV